MCCTKYLYGSFHTSVSTISSKQPVIMSDEPKRSSKYYNETAEVELVSSDNVAFKVPAFPLRYSS